MYRQFIRDPNSSVVNAISSFIFKYSILDEWRAKNLDVHIPTNIYLTKATGKAIENEDGIIESAILLQVCLHRIVKVLNIFILDFSIDIRMLIAQLLKHQI